MIAAAGHFVAARPPHWLFMLSDSLLAWDRFDGPMPLAALWVLATYYLSLWWLARSVAREDTLIKADALP